MASITVTPLTSNGTRLSSGSLRVNAQTLKRSSSSGGATRSLSFEKSGYFLRRTDAISAQEFNRFIESNQDLINVIDQSRAAQAILKKKSISRRADLVDVLAETASSLLEGQASRQINKAALEKSPLLSSLIVLNVGGVRTALNNSDEAVSLVAQAESSSTKDINDALAEKASSLFTAGNSLNDPDFFEERPDVAAYLINNPELVKSFNSTADGLTRAAEFKLKVDSRINQDMFDLFLKKEAARITDSGAYDEDFFEENTDVAAYVIGSEVLEGVPKASQFLRENPQFVLSNNATGDRFNFSGLVHSLNAVQARNHLSFDSPLSVDLLRENKGLTRLINKSGFIREQLNSRESKFQLSGLFSPSKGSFSLSNELFTSLREKFTSGHQNLGQVLSYIA